MVQNSLHKDLFYASDNKTEHFLLYLEDLLDFFWGGGGGGGGGGGKATHLSVVAYSVLQYLLSLYYFEL